MHPAPWRNTHPNVSLTIVMRLQSMGLLVKGMSTPIMNDMGLLLKGMSTPIMTWACY